MKPVIEVYDISKSYQISHQTRAAYGTLKDDFANILKRPFDRGIKEEKEIFWALKDVSFEVNEGEAFGIIGKNGSGKSTMLKILSRIVDPTKGTAKLHGKVASMLEVGTGFHPELTGRENIFFNGSMIGMSRQEIRRKFDDIVAFSEVEKFLDTPVKFYSSGMYVRLAFAVAAHLEPDILIIDEVLSVGDASFQKKCMKKMLSITKEGRTIIFVSHSIAAVEELCDRVLLLEKGRIKLIDQASVVADKYLGSDLTTSVSEESEDPFKTKEPRTKEDAVKIPIADRVRRDGTGRVKVTKLEIKNEIREKQQLKIDCVLRNVTKRKFENYKFSIDVLDKDGNYVSNCLNYTIGQTLGLEPGDNKVSMTMNRMSLVPGAYFIDVFIARDFDNSEIFDWVEGAASFRVPSYDYYHVKKVPRVSGNFVYLDFKIEEGRK